MSKSWLYISSSVYGSASLSMSYTFTASSGLLSVGASVLGSVGASVLGSVGFSVGASACVYDGFSEEASVDSSVFVTISVSDVIDAPSVSVISVAVDFSVDVSFSV